MASGMCFLPGAKLKIDGPFIEDGQVWAPVKLYVQSWPKLLWHVIRTEYDVKWQQWPYVMWTIAKITVGEKTGLWQAFTLSDT